MVLKSKTVFVLGAGASKEFGFPTGAELKNSLATRLNIGFSDGYNQSSGDRAIADALHSLGNSTSGRSGDITAYIRKARMMVDGLPQSISIDNYIDAQEDADIALLGKIAISRELLHCERKSSIYFENPDDRSAMLRDSQNSHYHSMFQLLAEGIRRSNADTIFDNVSFISFNYDRSLEWYFKHAVENFFQLTDPHSSMLLGRLNIIHPYGTVGELPNYYHSKNAVPFGGSQGVNYGDIAQEIRTFTEQINDAALSNAIELEICSAVRIVFLGFGFHDINMQTLATSRPSQLRHVIGTSLGVSDSDREQISRTIVQSFSSHTSSPPFNINSKIDLRSDLLCSDIFSEYGRSLRS